MRSVLPSPVGQLAPAAAGWAGATAVDRAARRLPRARVALHAAGLATAAAIYPLARLGGQAVRTPTPAPGIAAVGPDDRTPDERAAPTPGPGPDGHATRELAALAAFGVAALLAARRSDLVARRTLAAGWLAHALFDAVHETGPASRIPAWYPAFCAGYDGGVAVGLLRA